MTSSKENVGPFGPRKWQGEKVKTGSEKAEEPAMTTRASASGTVANKAEQAKLAIAENEAKARFSPGARVGPGKG